MVIHCAPPIGGLKIGLEIIILNRVKENFVSRSREDFPYGCGMWLNLDE